MALRITRDPEIGTRRQQLIGTPNSNPISQDSDDDEDNIPQINDVESLKKGIVKTLKNKAQAPYTILLVGETGVGKSSILELIANVLSRNDADHYNFHILDHSNERGGPGNQSQTNSARIYDLPTKNGMLVRILDTPGLTDTRGPQQNEIHKKSIATQIQMHVDSVTAVIILANGTVPNLTVGMEYALTTLSSTFPNSLENNIAFMFTNVSSALSWNFSQDTLPDVLKHAPKFLLDNPIALQNKYLKLKVDPNMRNPRKELRIAVKEGEKKALEMLVDFFDWLDGLEPRLTTAKRAELDKQTNAFKTSSAVSFFFLTLDAHAHFPIDLKRQDAEDETAGKKYDLSPNLVNSVVQQQELVRFLTADGFSSDLDNKIFTNERSSIFSRHWNGSEFGQKEFITDNVRPNSSAAYIVTNNERFVFCISHDSSFRVLKYDDEEDWLDLEDLPCYAVHSKGQMAGYVGLNGKRYALFQDPSHRLMCLDETWTPTILPVKATSGTPIAHIILGTSGHPRLFVFYLGKDLHLHYLEQGFDGIWSNDSLFTEVYFEDKLKKMVMVWNEEKETLEAYLLTAKKGVFQVTQGEGEILSLGKIEDDKFIPGTDAEFADFNLSGQRDGSWSLSGRPVSSEFAAHTQFAPPLSGQGPFQPRFTPTRDGSMFGTPPPPYEPVPQPDTGSLAPVQTSRSVIEHFFNANSVVSPPEGMPLHKIRTRSGPQLPVCIIGAGVSGLYIAMILDSLDIKYEIMEGSGRTGGRLYTHHFPKYPGKYQYYDVGAMRFPKTTFMSRTFDLAERRLGLTMLPYIRSNDSTFLSYNGISITNAENKRKNLDKEDVFKVCTKNDGHIPEDYFRQGVRVFWDKILNELREYFVDYPFSVAFEKLKQWEDYSVTSYLLLIKKVPYPVIKWWETMESRTGLFEQSLVETVLASLLFMDPTIKDNTANWWCFDGGSETLHKAMTAHIRTKPQHYMRVIAVKETDTGQSLTVTFDSNHNPRPSGQRRIEKKYSQVISTMSLGCLRMIDLDQLQMSYGQRNAVRELIYTPSIKIGIQFKTAWWEKLGIVGGQSSTDRPIRDIVYPSYGPDSSHPGNKKSNCIIGSYNGMQDSQRLGGLMKGKDTPQERIMIDLVMRDLAAVHNVDVEELWDEYEDYHAWDFYRDEFQLGAFCQFGPNQFKHSYPYLTQPASKDQRFHFAGDATSTFHGWVAGALNSAWRAVLGMLLAHPELNPNPDEDITAKFKKEWGDCEEWDQATLARHTYLGRRLVDFQPV